MESGELAGSVAGSERYVVIVSVTDGEIQSCCSCPVGFDCKHAVALVLEYLDREKKGQSVLTLSADDPRFSTISRALTKSGIDVASIFGTAGNGVGIAGIAGKTGPDPGAESLRSYLSEYTKDELLDLLLDLARSIQEVDQFLSDRQAIERKNVAPLVESLLDEIDMLTEEPSWSNKWTGEGSIPDYSHVRDTLLNLSSSGYTEEVLLIGTELLKKGPLQVEQSDDDGAVAGEIESCMEIVFQALGNSSMPVHERMLYALDSEIQDEFGLCRGTRKFWAHEFSNEDWSMFADRLLSRLQEMHSGRFEDLYSSCYGDNHLIGTLITALDHAGRHNEVVPLCIAEIANTCDYQRLVRTLITDGRKDEAREWLFKGISKMGPHTPGAAELRKILLGMWEYEGNWPSVAGLRADEFVNYPSLSSFLDLQVAANRAGVWDKVEGPARQYLITGVIPGNLHHSGDGNGVFFGILPDSGTIDWERLKPRPAPFFDILIELAIHEEKPDEVIRWYDNREENKSPYYTISHNIEDNVANALKVAYPDRALEIWRNKVEKFIAETKPRSYELAAGYLVKMFQIMKDLDRIEEWDCYISDLRKNNVRKKRLMEVLNHLEED